MMDTLRSGLRLLSATFMNSELVYSLLMGMGWLFLMGWAIALLVACASAFRRDRTAQLAGGCTDGSGHLPLKGTQRID